MLPSGVSAHLAASNKISEVIKNEDEHPHSYYCLKGGGGGGDILCSFSSTLPPLEKKND